MNVRYKGSGGRDGCHSCIRASITSSAPHHVTDMFLKVTSTALSCSLNRVVVLLISTVVRVGMADGVSLD